MFSVPILIHKAIRESSNRILPENIDYWQEIVLTIRFARAYL